MRLAEDYFPERALPKTGKCELYLHYRDASVLRMVTRAICMLADNNDQHLVFASVEAIRNLCWHYEDNKRWHPSLRAVKYALAFLRKQGIISDRNIKLVLTSRGTDRTIKTSERAVSKGRPRTGFVVVHHDALAVRDEETCAIVSRNNQALTLPDGALLTVNPNAVF